MKRSTTTSDKQISLFGEDELTFSPVAFPANRSRRQAKEKESMTTDTSGRLCLRQFEQSAPDGSWVRMFSELLIGMPGWYSSRCALTWKLKTTKSNRLYFQLVASTLPTADTEPSLLPTVTTTNASQGLNSTKNPVSGSSGTLAQEIMSGFVYRRGILPTQTATDWKPCFSPSGMIRKDGKSRNDLLRNIPVVIGEHCQQRPGTTSQLSPLFVEEMMGFPNGWILLPFLKESFLPNELRHSTAGDRNP